jgi:MFS family permease
MLVAPSLLGRGWLHPAILSACGLAMAAGFGQFAVTATLGDVAEAFDMQAPQNGVAAEVGVSLTTLGVGLAVIRLAGLAALPAASLADRVGRRRLLLGAAGVGLALTAAAALSPGFWWFVALAALARPLLSATNGVVGVVAAEETTSEDRAKAIALAGASFAVGSGLLALVRGVVPDVLGFRGVFALALVPLALILVLSRWVRDPDRYSALSEHREVRPRFGRVGAKHRGRLATLVAVSAGIGLVTGPANTYVFVYGERIVGYSPAQMALLILSAGPVGLLGLLSGRWAADRLGRRVTAVVGLSGTALAAMVTYSGEPVALVVGFLTATFLASVLAPAGGSLAAEVFPTSVRATAAGWLGAAIVTGAVTGLVLFGAVAEHLDSFGLAAAVVGLPVAVAANVMWLLPETKGLELEESAPEPG